MKNKKVAVIIAGMPRNFDELFPVIKEQLIEINQNNKFDLFLNTSYENSSNKIDSVKLDESIKSKYSKEAFVNYLEEIYNPYLKSIQLLDNYSSKKPLSYFNENKRFLYVLRCEQGIEEALNYSQKNNFKYDSFICMRTDITFTKNIDLNLFQKEKTLYFICSEHTRPGFFHNRDWDFFCMGDYDAIKEWTKVWQYREDTIAHFPQPDITKFYQLPKCAKGTWSKEEAESLSYKFAYRLVPSCIQNDIDIDICTAENQGLFAKMTPKYTKFQMYIMKVKQIIKKVLIAFGLWK